MRYIVFSILISSLTISCQEKIEKHEQRQAVGESKIVQTDDTKKRLAKKKKIYNPND